MSGKISVNNLPHNVRERQLDEIFHRYGRIEEIEIRGSRSTENSRRRNTYAIITFRDYEGAEQAAKREDGRNFAGVPMKIDIESGRHGGRGRGYYDMRDGGGHSRGHGSGSASGYDSFGMSERYFRVVVTNLPRGASWQDLKDKMRDAGDVRFTEVTNDGVGVAGFGSERDVDNAVRQLHDTDMRSHHGETSYIKVEAYSEAVHGEQLGRIGGKGRGKGGKGRSHGGSSWGGDSRRSPSRRRDNYSRRKSPSYGAYNGGRNRSRSRSSPHYD